tara:strand:+ start:300 stop:1145 length:846 start_codon:yes stop_codon:yes gene_type:complete
MEILDLLNSGSRQLKNNNIISCRLDSEILLAKILNKKREKLLINLNKKVSQENVKYYKKLILRRASNEPIAYILEEKEFWSKNYYVNKNTLIPRPETELMVEKISDYFKKKKNLNILDIGTGTGCILLSILSELKSSKGVGIDICKEAIKVATKNSIKHNLKHKSKFYRKSFTEIYNHKFDLIVSNPPYIERKELKNLKEDIKNFEPKLALDGGNDGLDVIRKVIYKSNEILKVKGMLALEIGNEQFKKVSIILKKNKFRIRFLIKDYRDNVRGIVSIKES